MNLRLLKDFVINMAFIDEEETKISKKDWMLWLGVGGIAALLVIAFRGKWGSVSFDSATFDAAMIVLGTFLMTETLIWFKHRTPKFVYDGNPGFTTFFARDLRKVGRWGIARKGGILAGGVYWSGGEGTVVAPYDAFTPVADCIVCLSKCEPTELSKLPPTVRKYLSDNKFPMPVEFGLFTNTQLRVPEISKMREEIKELNAYIALLETEIAEVRTTRESSVEFYKRVSEKPGFDWLKGKLIEKRPSE